MLQKIRDLCEDKGISIAKLERACGIGNGTIGRWNESTPTIDNLKKVAKFFDKPIEYFLE